jgi:hypothetical protein
MTTTKTATHIDHVIVGPSSRTMDNTTYAKNRVNADSTGIPRYRVPVAPLGPASSRSWSRCHKQQSGSGIPFPRSPPPPVTVRWLLMGLLYEGAAKVAAADKRATYILSPGAPDETAAALMQLAACRSGNRARKAI